MPLLESMQPDTQKSFKLGRRRSTAYGPRMCLSRYVDFSQLSEPPEEFDYSEKAMDSLSDIYMNDELGICVVSAGYHIQGVLHHNAGKPFDVTRQQLVKDYSNIGGYNGNPRTDNGCDMQTALNWWLSKGWQTGGKIEGYISVDPTDIREVTAACYLFEHLFLATNLPRTWLPENTRPSSVWDADRRLSGGGHAFMVCARKAAKWKLSTWGMLIGLTDAGMHQIEEAYVIIDDVMLETASQKAPNGFDWSSLVRDFNQLGGKLPEPTPAPPVVIDWYM